MLVADIAVIDQIVSWSWFYACGLIHRYSHKIFLGVLSYLCRYRWMSGLA